MYRIVAVAAPLIGILSLLPAQETTPTKSIEQLIEQLNIACDRLVPGQRIGFEAKLK